MIRVVLADDEVLGRQKLRRLLRDVGDIEIIGECSTARETIELVKLAAPDLLFLDIRMPDMDGFDVVDAVSPGLKQIRPRIIFVTANDSFAVRAFDVHAIDYLLKPFTAERLFAAVQRAREQLTLNQVDLNGHGAEPSRERYTTRIVFKSRGRILFLSVSDIRWIEAQENYVKICTGSESHLLRETIGRMESRLDPQNFLRVHRSAIVNLHHVKEVKNDANGEAIVVLLSGEKIPISRTYRPRIEKLLQI